MKVRVTEFEIGGKTLAEVPDLASLPRERVLREYDMPYIRGVVEQPAIGRPDVLLRFDCTQRWRIPV